MTRLTRLAALFTACLALAACGTDSEVSAGPTAGPGSVERESDASGAAALPIPRDPFSEVITTADAPPIRFGTNESGQVCLTVEIGERGGGSCSDRAGFSSDFFVVLSTAPEVPERIWVIGVAPAIVESVRVNDGPPVPTVPSRMVPEVALYAVPLDQALDRTPEISGTDVEGRTVRLVASDPAHE